jgi:RNA recognition motif-containing protein
MWMMLGVLQLSTKLYVGNLSYGVSNNELERMFAAHGTVYPVAEQRLSINLTVRVKHQTPYNKIGTAPFSWSVNRVLS